MIKFGMVVVTGREKSDMGDVDVVVDWMLQPAAWAMVGKRKRESWRDVSESEIQPGDHRNQP
jgi:hypothetical protein